MIRALILSLFTFFSMYASANVLGDMQTFVPNTDGLDFISVHSSRPLTKGFFAFGGHFSYAKDHLVVFKDFTTQDRYKYKDQLLEFDLDVSYAFTEKFSVFLAAPWLLWQESEGGQDVDVEISRGLHTFRPGFKWNLMDDAFALIASVDILNVTNSPYTGVDSNPIYNIELAKTFKAADKVAYGLNVGYRLREPTENPVDSNMFPLDDQILFSAARSAPAFRRGRWVLESIFSFPVDKDPYKKTEDASSIDILLGFKHRLMRNLNFDWGGTIEPVIDTQSPKFRVFAGLVYYWNPGWSSNQDKEAPPPPTVFASGRNEEAESEAAKDESGAAPGDPLMVTPEFIEVFEGAIVRYKVSGGASPYSYRVIEGKGRFDLESVYYRAPMAPETARIEVRDTRNAKVEVQVLVRRAPKPNETIRIKNLNFHFDTANLVNESVKEIKRIIALFNKKTVSRIIVEGHTDSLGSDAYNLDLSERRAQTVRRELITGLGLNDDQVHAIGFGEERPITTNKTDKGRLANRRVDLKVYYNR